MNPGGATPEHSQHPRLTEEDLELIALIALGFSNSDIAGRLNASEHEVKERVSGLLAKLELSERMELILYAYTDPNVKKRVLAITARGDSAA
jgi:DNA-binding NarL/FixJ family response regulator